MKKYKNKTCDNCRQWIRLRISDNPLVTKYHDFPNIPIEYREFFGTCSIQCGVAYPDSWYCAGWEYGKSDKHHTINKSKIRYRNTSRNNDV